MKLGKNLVVKIWAVNVANDIASMMNSSQAFRVNTYVVIDPILDLLENYVRK